MTTALAQTVLIADDDPTARVLMRATLERAGFRVVEAVDGAAALALFDRERPDLVVLDVMMPVTDGFEACREIRARPAGEKIPILFLTGLDDVASIERAFELGATDFESKPVNWTTLHYRLRYMLRASRAFEELAQAWRAAESAREARGTFLASMSHELRTPMTVILGYLDQLVADGAIDRTRPETRDALERIERSGSALMRMVSQALDMAQIEKGVLPLDLSLFRPDELATEILGSWRAEANGRDLRLELDARDVEPVVSDARRIGEILSNLVHNAVKFTRAGVIRVRVGLTRGTSATLHLAVEDTGIGIEPDDLSRIFEPFEQADSSAVRVAGGAGLGLAIVRELVRLLHGQIDVESTPGRGSRFQVHVPVRLERRGSERPRTSVVGRSLDCRVLYAEDSPDNQRLVQHVLGRAGARVECAENGELCVERLLADPTAYDVILMDMQMPTMDGYEATRRLRAAGIETPIVALTAHVMTGDREKCLSAGCDDYLPKPFDRVALLNAVASWAEKARTD